ncbi:MAG: RNase adapter RapZ [Xanthomonadales bacterium]|nr:RNase adapter RapZ [Xanthomonadales bacterium]
MSQTPQHVIVVTGLSGAGKSTALNALEDMGYRCIDNLPAALLETLAEQLQADPGRYERVALGMDVRASGQDLGRVPEWLAGLRSKGVKTQLLFLNARDESLLKRFGETRRPHPLAPDQGALQAAIGKERELLETLRTIADWEIDTSSTNIHQLKHQTWRCIGPNTEALTLVIQSFGFSRGVPADVDFLFDARSLPNPHWDKELRAFTGRDPAVAEWLEQEPDVPAFCADILIFLRAWLPRFEAAHRSFVTVGIGCTGGRHRSVYLAERLSAALEEDCEDIMLHHRELQP